MYKYLYVDFAVTDYNKLSTVSDISNAFSPIWEKGTIDSAPLFIYLVHFDAVIDHTIKMNHIDDEEAIPIRPLPAGNLLHIPIIDCLLS